jgi:hypothetical protein
VKRLGSYLKGEELDPNVIERNVEPATGE